MRKPVLFTALAVSGLVALGGSLGCARQVRIESGPAADTAGSDTVSGVVRQVGNTPFVRTIVEGDAGSVQVVGPYEAEIARLVGARVRVVGQREGSGSGAMGPRLRASGYTILAVDGDRPQVGYLQQSDGGDFYLRTEDGSQVPLTSVSSALAEKVGAKIWVVTSDAGAVVRYGILREPS